MTILKVTLAGIKEEFGVRQFFLCFGILIICLSVILPSGCIGFQKSNLTVTVPESIVTSIGKQEILNIELLPLEADAKDVVINISGPSEISLIDPHSREFKTLAKEQKFSVPVNYSAISDGTFNLTLEIKAANTNATNSTITINSYVPAPKLEIGEFWVYNNTKGNALGLRVNEVVRKDVIDGKEYYVIKGTWEGEPNGTYSLSYYSADAFLLKMSEYYEDSSLLKEKTLENDPPSSGYGFPFTVGKKWSWSGSITGIGKSEINGEIVKRENVTVPGGTYTSYYIQQKMTFSVGTGVGELWYVPELNEVAKLRISSNALGITTEYESELLEHGKPPAKPRQIQQDINIPMGYRLYKNDQFDFRIAYPVNWKFGVTGGQNYVSFSFTDGSIYEAYVTVEYIGPLNLTEYREFRLNYMKRIAPGIKISEEKSITINGREGFEWVWETTSTGEKGKQVIFVADSTGYLVGEYSLDAYYTSYEPIFDNIVNSFFITGSPKYTLS